MHNQTVTLNGDNINLSEISRSTGISVSHLSKVFSGKRTPSLQVLKLIADEVHMTLDDLAGELIKNKLAGRN